MTGVRTPMAESSQRRVSNGPLADLDDWESAYDSRESSAVPEGKDPSEFRDYRSAVRPEVREFYRLNHTHQSLALVLEKKKEYLGLSRRRMGIWEAMEF